MPKNSISNVYDWI